MNRTWTIVILHERDGRYSAVSPALGCASWGDTIPEVLQNVEEAIRLYLEGTAELGIEIPQDTDTFTVDMSDAVDAVIYRVTVREVQVVA